MFRSRPWDSFSELKGYGTRKDVLYWYGGICLTTLLTYSIIIVLCHRQYNISTIWIFNNQTNKNPFKVTCLYLVICLLDIMFRKGSVRH